MAWRRDVRAKYSIRVAVDRQQRGGSLEILYYVCPIQCIIYDSASILSSRVKFARFTLFIFFHAEIFNWNTRTRTLVYIYTGRSEINVTKIGDSHIIIVRPSPVFVI